MLVPLLLPTLTVAALLEVKIVPEPLSRSMVRVEPPRRSNPAPDATFKLAVGAFAPAPALRASVPAWTLIVPAKPVIFDEPPKMLIYPGPALVSVPDPLSWKFER